ncbi:hypothetical protein F4825DRAFT_474090 [Nemania diffusa]|nr:hypothetical protein F4825DRAFT_474090 [Nemania diffusa]
MPSIFKSTFMLAMAATAISRPLQSQNTQTGNSGESLATRNPAQDLPIALIESLIGKNRQGSAYDEDVATADPTEILGKRAQDIPIALIQSLIGKNRQGSAYDEDVAAADPSEVLGKRAQDLPIALIESLIGKNREGSAYDEDVAAADPTEVLGRRGN